jgi:hypothetical protein
LLIVIRYFLSKRDYIKRRFCFTKLFVIMYCTKKFSLHTNKQLNAWLFVSVIKIFKIFKVFVGNKVCWLWNTIVCSNIGNDWLNFIADSSIETVNATWKLKIDIKPKTRNHYFQFNVFWLDALKKLLDKCFLLRICDIHS